MKNSSKILNLLSAFMAIIGLCAVTLVCFIFIYSQINGDFTKKQNNTPSSQNSIVYPSEYLNENVVVANNQNNQLSEDSSLKVTVNQDEIEIQSSTKESSETAHTDVSSEYKSALIMANTYSDIMHLSKAGIYDQLVSEYGENFSADAAQYAIDNMTADWNANALQKAKEYSETMHLSKLGIYDQLISDYGEKFTPSEAQYAIDNLVTDYNLNALQKAKEYQSLMDMSPSSIHDQLTSEYGEKFTQEEADYAIANLY